MLETSSEDEGLEKATLSRRGSFVAVTDSERRFLRLIDRAALIEKIASVRTSRRMQRSAQLSLEPTPIKPGAAQLAVKRMKYLHPILFVLIFTGLAIAGDSYECSYYQNGVQDLVTEKNCLIYSENVRNKITGGDALISKSVEAKASYDEDGLGFLYSPVGVFYFTKSGLARKTIYFDNGPDYFSEGLARTEWNGKIGFFDKKLSIVIEPRFDFAFPFKNGLAVVCKDCTPKKLKEHVVIAGGKWGAINTKGEFVQPIIYSKRELDALIEKSR